MKFLLKSILTSNAITTQTFETVVVQICALIVLENPHFQFKSPYEANFILVHVHKAILILLVWISLILLHLLEQCA